MADANPGDEGGDAGSPTPEARGEAAANSVVAFFSPFVRMVAAFWNQLTYVVMRLLPFVGAAFWKRLTLVSLKNYHRRAGGDAIALKGKQEAGTATIEPIQWQDGIGDIEDSPGWAMKSEDRKFKPSRHGDPVRLGKVPIVPIRTGDTRAGSLLECDVVEAIDQGRTRPLYRVGDDAELQARIDANGALGAGTQAVSDGGHNVQRAFDPGESPIFEDVVVDLSPNGDWDGQATSFFKYSDADPDKTSPEQLEITKNRALLAGMAGKDMQSLLVKIMLIAGAIALGGLIGPELVSALIGGGGGGGGGGIVPISLSLPFVG